MMTPGENRADLEAKNRAKQNKITTWRSHAPARHDIPKHRPWPQCTSLAFCPFRALGWSLGKVLSPPWSLVFPIRPAISPILRAGHIAESHAIDIELVAGRVHLCVQERTVPRTRLFRLRRTSRGREMAHCQVSTKGYESQTHLQS